MAVTMEISFGTLADRLEQVQAVSKQGHASIINKEWAANIHFFLTSDLLEKMNLIQISEFDIELSPKVIQMIESLLETRSEHIERDEIEVYILKNDDAPCLQFCISQSIGKSTANFLSHMQRVNKANDHFKNNPLLVDIKFLKPFFENITFETQITLAHDMTLYKFFKHVFGKQVDQCHVILSPNLLTKFWKSVNKYQQINLSLHLSPMQDKDQHVSKRKYWVQFVCNETNSSLVFAQFNFK